MAVQGAWLFRRNKTTINPVDLESASALVTSGVFRFSRNPMYVGFTAMLVGWAVCLAAPWALIGPAAFVLFTNRAVKLHFSYQRFLENQIREAFGFLGTPIWIKNRARNS